MMTSLFDETTCGHVPITSSTRRVDMFMEMHYALVRLLPNVRLYGNIVKTDDAAGIGLLFQWFNR